MNILKIQDTTIQNIADAIREKTKALDAYTPLEMPDAIRSIEGGGSGVKFDTVLEYGQISNANPGQYVIATFEHPLPACKYILVKTYCYVAERDVLTTSINIFPYEMLQVSATDRIDFSTTLWGTNDGTYVEGLSFGPLTVRFSETTIEATNYGGQWRDIYAAVLITDGDIFPV